MLTLLPVLCAGLAAVATPEAPRQRTSCAARFPTAAAAGVQVGFEPMWLRGRAEMPAGGNGHVVMRVFAAGESSRAVIEGFGPERGGEFTVAAPREAGAVRWFECGESPTLVAQIEVIARLAPDATDAATRLSVEEVAWPRLHYRSCD